MTEWQTLLDHIYYYVYSPEEEQISFLKGANMVEAQNYYRHIVSTYGIDKNVDDLWAFDIALDCVRRMADEDKMLISENTDASLYHFGYALGVRNKYIHVATKHFTPCPDDLSSRVMEMIFAILSPEYVLEFTMSN